MIFLSGTKNKVRITLHVQPNASRTALRGKYGDALKIAVQEPPVEGAANQEVHNFLTKLFGVAKKSVTQISGQRGRRKIYEIAISLDNATSILKEHIP